MFWRIVFSCSQDLALLFCCQIYPLMSRSINSSSCHHKETHLPHATPVRIFVENMVETDCTQGVIAAPSASLRSPEEEAWAGSGVWAS